MKDQEVKYINYQIILSFIFILTILVSIYLAYNSKEKIITGKGIISINQSYVITLVNRIVVFLILSCYVYFDSISYKFDKEENKGLVSDTLEIIASLLSVSAALIILIAVAFYYYENEDISFENPQA